MSTAPQRETESQGHAANAHLADALTDQGKARAALGETDDQIERARASGAASFVYTWDTEDDRQAEFLVYYTATEEVDVLACQLLQIDGEPPTSRQRVHYEESFSDELASYGDLWSEVASHAWERTA